MSARIIDGKLVASAIKESLRPRIEKLKARGITPGLATVLVGNDPSSLSYVTSKAKACLDLGMYSESIQKPAELTQTELVSLVQRLNRDDRIHGILIQSPLPAPLDELTLTLAIDPAKDVDGFHPYNVGMMLLGHGGLLPCTPHGMVKLLEHYQISPSGKEVVVVGRSNIVGKPIAALLMQKGRMADATVTVAHSRSSNLPEITRRADILIVAIGRANAITADMVRPGVVIIDVGVNRVDDPKSKKGYRLTGDVDFEPCAEKAAYITPVPGGVGPMTIAMLMSNTVTAAEQASRTTESR